MSTIKSLRSKLRGELEAPPTLRKFGSGRISGALALQLASLESSSGKPLTGINRPA